MLLRWLTLTAVAFAPSLLVAADLPEARIAAIVTVYHHNSHADCIVGRLLQTDTLDGKGQKFRLKLASIYVDQIHPPGKPGQHADISATLLPQFGLKPSATIREALTLGTGKLAVDGVLMVCEHGDYPDSPLGSMMYPKRKFFDEIVAVGRESNRFVPIFNDKHLEDDWNDIKAIYDTAQQHKIPLIGGSSLPVAWRHPPVDVDRTKKLKDILIISYHRLDVYGFHALEMLQCLVERRPGGESGIKAVQCLTGEAVWAAEDRGEYDRKLLLAALVRQNWKTGWERRGGLRKVVKDPTLFIIEYADGLKAHMLTLNGAVGDFCAAWRYEDGHEESTLFFIQDARPLAHFTYLLKAAEETILTGKPPWPIERTLLTSGVLDALLISKNDGGRRLETPQLIVPYQTSWNWQQPPPPPPNRPYNGP